MLRARMLRIATVNVVGAEETAPVLVAGLDAAFVPALAGETAGLCAPLPLPLAAGLDVTVDGTA
jgi:hypothetical protein